MLRGILVTAATSTADCRGPGGPSDQGIASPLAAEMGPGPEGLEAVDGWCRGQVQGTSAIPFGMERRDTPPGLRDVLGTGSC